MKKPKVFRCSRCHELRNGPPKIFLDPDFIICKQCDDETQGRVPSKLEAEARTS